MMVNKIYLMSPREPSGATWLINCLLELGIKTYRQSSPDMWEQLGNNHILSSHEEILKKWLPALWDNQQFKFRNDIEVEWSHEWPTLAHDRYPILYFARDPRDSLYSRYKREAPSQTFEEFLLFPDVNTLLNKAHNWRLFNLAWMQHPHHQVFRFEDYKEDAAQVLTKVLDFLGLTYTQADMQRALFASTFEQAAQAELKYRAKYPEDKELINRSGKTGEWKQGGMDSNALNYIENICADAMHLQGYACTEVQRQEFNYSKLVSALPFLQRLKLPEFTYLNSGGIDLSVNALEFGELLKREVLQQAGLRSYEIGSLLDSMTILSKFNKSESQNDFVSLYKAFGLEYGWLSKFSNLIKVVLRRFKRMFV